MIVVAKIETVKHPYGIDTGLISYIIRTAQLFKSKIIIESMITGKRADARQLRELFDLYNSYNTDVKIEAEGEDEEKIRAAKGYCENYITKPISLETLKTKIDKVFEIQSLKKMR